VKFHPDDSNKLISGATDGLINIYDLSQSREDDALIDSLNTESSIEKLGWLQRGGKDVISCVTPTEDVQFWKLDDAQPYLHLRRCEIATEIHVNCTLFIFNLVSNYILRV
jgi:WD40 repeat protein